MNFVRLKTDRWINVDTIDCIVFYLYPGEDQGTAWIYPSSTGMYKEDYDELMDVCSDQFVTFTVSDQSMPGTPPPLETVIKAVNIKRICSISKDKNRTIVWMHDGDYFDAPAEFYDEVTKKIKASYEYNFQKGKQLRKKDERRKDG